MQPKWKLFIENFIIFGLGSMLSKIIPLIMLPVITRLMPDTFYFGINDMVNIISSFATAIAILGIYDAMFRLYFDKSDISYRKEVCSTSLFIVSVGSIIVVLSLIIFREYFSTLVFKSSEYEGLVIISALIVIIGAINTILMAPTRMENKRKTFLLTNFITSLIGFAISIPLLIRKNFLYALPMGTFLAALLIFIIYIYLNKSYFKIKFINLDLSKELIKIGIPLMPTFLIYWILNSCDRMFIKEYLGLKQVGIYSIGAKVASISQLIYQGFAQGWGYFAYSTMKDEDNVETVSKIFQYLFIISFVAILTIQPFIRFIFGLLFKGDYAKGYIVFPYLFLAPLMLMLFQTIASQLIVIKKSYLVTVILMLGAISSLTLNYLLIPTIGIKGSGISAVLSYTLVVIVTAVILKKLKMLKINKRILLHLSLFISFIIIISLDLYSFIVSIIIMLVLGVSMKQEILFLKSKFIK